MCDFTGVGGGFNRSKNMGNWIISPRFWVKIANHISPLKTNIPWKFMRLEDKIINNFPLKWSLLQGANFFHFREAFHPPPRSFKRFQTFLWGDGSKIPPANLKPPSFSAIKIYIYISTRKSDMAIAGKSLSYVFIWRYIFIHGWNFPIFMSVFWNCNDSDLPPTQARMWNGGVTSFRKGNLGPLTIAMGWNEPYK